MYFTRKYLELRVNWLQVPHTKTYGKELFSKVNAGNFFVASSKSNFVNKFTDYSHMENYKRQLLRSETYFCNVGSLSPI